MTSDLFNCCTNGVAPDWSKFRCLTHEAMADFDGRSEIAEEGCGVSFWCIFGIDDDALYHPITDCYDLESLERNLQSLSALSGLPVT